LKYLTIFILLIINTTPYAGLTPWGVKKLKKHVNDYSLEINDEFAATIWGNINEPKIVLENHSIFDDPLASLTEWKGASSKFKTGFLKGKLLSWSKDTSKKGRPLYIVIPGAFSQLSTPQTTRYAFSLFKQGYNVIMLPNPLSIDYLSNEPLYWPGSTFKESNSIIESVNNWLYSNESKRIQISEINIVGTSYGGFVSGIISGTKKDWKGLHSKTFIIAPPRYLSSSMKLVDGYIRSSLKYVSNYKFIEMYKMLSKALMVYIGGPRKNFLDKEVLNEIQSFVVVHGFQKLFMESLEYTHRVLKKKTYSLLDNFNNFDNYKTLERTLSFSNYSKSYLNETKRRLNGRDGDLLTWVKSEEASNIEIRILTTSDDWVNSPNDWPVSEGILILPRGGHFGFRGGDWLDNLMKDFF
jgi:hypothetical protein